MELNEKCTFVHKSKIGAPTFKAFKTVAGTEKIMNAKYDFHYAEYNTGTNSQPVLDLNIAGDALQVAKSLPKVSFTWATLKGRMYDKDQYAGIIEMPQAWMWTDATASNGSDATKTGYRKMRWFPVWVAEAQVKAQNARVTSYNALKATYDPLKKAYDDAVGAKPAAAGLFGAPAKKTIIVRPNMPTAPAAYTGLYQHGYPLANYAVATSLAGTNTSDKVLANEFVASGSHGGWGAFTMGFLKQADAFQKSFGVFGWAKDADAGTDWKAEDQSFVEDWGDMCIVTTPAVAGNGSCPTQTAAWSTTATIQILVVSVWTRDQTAVVWSDATNGGTLEIQFNLSKWKQNAAAWAKPTAPVAATAPVPEPAGAKMLAVSAALVAAALY